MADAKSSAIPIVSDMKRAGQLNCPALQDCVTGSGPSRSVMP